MYTWNWSWIGNYKSQLIDAAIITLWLNIIILAIGTIAGILLGLGKRSKIKVIRYLCIGLIDILRTLPVLVLLIWFYFCVPIIFGVRISSFNSAIIVLSLNLAAFIAEIVDAGIQAVPHTHSDSARLLGFTHYQNLRYIIFPIAIRNMMPPIVGQYINSIKLSVLASVIAVPELLNVTQDAITQTFRPLEFYTVLALIFLVILLPGTIWSKRFETRAQMRKKASSEELQKS